MYVDEAYLLVEFTGELQKACSRWEKNYLKSSVLKIILWYVFSGTLCRAPYVTCTGFRQKIFTCPSHNWVGVLGAANLVSCMLYVDVR